MNVSPPVIVLWLWRGWRPIYDRRDAIAIARQIRAFGRLPLETRILLLTDLPADEWREDLDREDIEEHVLWPEIAGLRMPGTLSVFTRRHTETRPNCFRRLRLLDPLIQESLGIAPGTRIISMDLDTIVCASMVPLLDAWADDEPFIGMLGMSARINGSLWGFRARSCEQLWRDFNPQLSPTFLKRPIGLRPPPYGSDQAWFSRMLPTAPLWRPVHGAYGWGTHYLQLREQKPGVCFVSFAGPAKPRSVAVRAATPWIYEHAMEHYPRELAALAHA